MPKLTDNEFLQKRAQLIARWNKAAAAMLLLLPGLLVSLFLQSPYLVIPVTVAQALKQGSLPLSTMSLAAMMLPIMVLFLFFVVAIFILYGYSISSNEKRYQTIITALKNKQQLDVNAK